jgi:uncharacterized glyoxalase superfamily protein PhnB
MRNGMAAFSLIVCAAILAVFPGRITAGEEAKADPDAVAAAASDRLRASSVVYKDGEQELEGYLAWDPSQSGKRPGILVVHEWWGLNDYAKDADAAFEQAVAAGAKVRMPVADMSWGDRCGTVKETYALR